MMLHSVAMFAVLAASTASAQTNVSGIIATTTWTKANSPYRVTDTLTVPAANTLTIEPGVDVLFDAPVEFAVTGAVRAIGTETDSIRFMAGASAAWGGLRLGGGDSSAFAYARIANGRSAGGERSSSTESPRGRASCAWS